MNTTNHFEVAGVIRRIEERPCKNGGVWWLLHVEADGQVAPIVCFKWPTGGPLREGEGVRAAGSLTSSDQGYLRLKVARIERVVDAIASEPHRGGSTPSGSNGKPVTNGFEDGDGDLPF